MRCVIGDYMDPMTLKQRESLINKNDDQNRIFTMLRIEIDKALPNSFLLFAILNFDKK